MTLTLKSFPATAGGSTVAVAASQVVAMKFELVATSVVTITIGNAKPFTISKDWEITFPEPTTVKLKFSAATANAQCHLACIS